MTRKMTSITLPNAPIAGYADWDVKSPQHMIELIRKHAAFLRREAEAIEAAADDEFQIETYDGVHVRRNMRVIQDSSRRRAS